MTCFHQIKTHHVTHRKTSPEISCHFQARGDVSPSAIAWKNQVWDLKNLGVYVVWVSHTHCCFCSCEVFLWSYWFGIPSCWISVWMKHFQQEQDHALSPQTPCAPPVWRNPDCGLLLRTFRWDFMVIPALAEMMLLWRTMDALAKLGQPLRKIQEGVKNMEKKEEFSSRNGIWSNLAVLGHHWWRTICTKITEEVTPGALGYCLDLFPLWGANVNGCSLQTWLWVINTTNSLNSWGQTHLIFSCFLYYYFFTMSLHNTLRGACWSLKAGCNGNHGKS